MQKIRQGIQEELARQRKNVTFETSNSMRIQATELNAALRGSIALPALEDGRAPSSGAGRGGGMSLRQKILIWVRARNIQDPVKSQESIAYAIAKSIHDKGTLQFRKARPSGVLSNVINREALVSLRDEIARNEIEKFRVEVRQVSIRNVS